MWAYDGSRNVAAGEKKLSRGTTFVVAAVVVELPFLARPIALPVLARLWRPGGPPKTALARQLISLLADARRDRRFHVVADGAYLCTALRHLPANVTLTGPLPATRRSARSTPMSTTGSVARPAPHPRHEDRPPPPDHRHHAGPTGHGDPLRPHQDRQHLALVTTDPTTASSRSSNATPHGGPSRSPSLTPSRLRRVLIAAQYPADQADNPTPEGIQTIRLAWADAAV